MKVYALTKGSYSDYHIVGIYSSSEKAAEAKLLYGEDSGIEEYELDYLPEHPPGHLMYMVQMNAAGHTGIVKTESADNSVREWVPYGDGENVAFMMWATSVEHAVKIANERRAQLIANNEWTTDWSAWVDKRKIISNNSLDAR